MDLNSLRTNVDACIVNEFGSYSNFKKKFPMNSMTRLHFKAVQNFTEDCMGDLCVDVYNDNNRPGPKVINLIKIKNVTDILHDLDKTMCILIFKRFLNFFIFEKCNVMTNLKFFLCV